MFLKTDARGRHLDSPLSSSRGLKFRRYTREYIAL